ncbi:MAG: type I-C CRISPR-associated protein Cas8c/Csd1, partial [Aristaeellaceae bacterium]
MILQALVRHYDQLTQKGKLSRPGWLEVRVSYAIRLNQEGQLMALMDVREEKEQGKKHVMAPKEMTLPAPVKRASGVSANFLCDNAAYMLGIDSKGKPERAVQCFQACAALHQKLLRDVDDPMARAILAFFAQWDPAKAAEHELVAPLLKELAAANLVFRLDTTYAQEVPAIRQAWQAHYDAAPEGSASQRCLVTGEMAEIAKLHPAIKGVREAQSMGASLVSFNARAFESYGH